MKKLGICYILPPIEYYSPATGGAIATIAMNHVRELEKRGHRVKVLAPDSDAPKYDVGEVIPLSVGTRESLKIWQRGFSSKIVRPLRHYDWLYYEYYLRSLAAAIQSLADPPDVAFLFNDLQTPAFVRKHWPQTRLLLRLCNEVRTNHPRPAELLAQVDTVVACSDYIRRWILQTYGLPPEKVAHLPNGIDLSTFFPIEDVFDTPFLRGAGPLQVLFVGRANADKGGDMVAESVVILKSEGLRLNLRVAGAIWFYGNEKQDQDPYFQNLRLLLDKAEAEYLGHVSREDLGAVFRRADVVCMPSRWHEPFGNVALEAMASGCALITSRRGGLPEFCDGAAQLIDPDHPEELVNALRALATNGELLRQQKQRSLARAAEYSWENIGDALETLLTDKGSS